MSKLESVGRDHGAFYTAAQLVATDFPEPRWAVEGLIPEGLTLLAGAPKLGKSWLALNVGLSIASGAKALGKIPVAPGDVLYCALEDTPRRLKSRLTKILSDEPATADLALMTMLPQMPLAVELIAGWLDEHRAARLVVVDVLGKIRPASGASADRYESDYQVIGALKQLADNYRVAVMAVTHTRKMADGDVFNTVSGSTGLTGAADTTIVLRRARGEDGAALHVTGRDVQESEYAVTFNPDLGVWTLDGEALAEAAARAAEIRVSSGLDARSRALVAFVGEHPEGVKAKQVAETLDGFDHDQARVYLARLCKAERIQRLGTGLYGPAVASVAPVSSDVNVQVRIGADPKHPPMASVTSDTESDTPLDLTGNTETGVTPTGTKTQEAGTSRCRDCSTEIKAGTFVCVPCALARAEAVSDGD